MKKFLKIMACAMMVIAMSGVITSCKKNNESQNPNIDHTYTYYTFIDGLLSTGDIQKFSDYVYQKGGMRPYTMTGDFDTKEYTINAPSDEDCSAKADASAKADFEIVKGKLSADELHLLIPTTRTIEYQLCRTTNTEQYVIVDTWVCPGLTAPSEFGTLKVENNTDTITKSVKIGGQVSGTPGTQMAFYSRQETSAYNIVLGNLEEQGVVPVGHFEFGNQYCKGNVKYQNVMYTITNGSCDITKDGFTYTFVSSGQATSKDGAIVNFNLNLAKVVF